jgi:PAS domain S-box-containing protein
MPRCLSFCEHEKTDQRVTRLRRTPAAMLIVGGAAILCGALGLTSWRLFDTREMAIDSAYQTSQNLVSTLEVEIRRDLETYALSLQAVADGLKMPEIDTVGPKLRDAILFDNSSHAPQYGSILVLDEQGRLKLGSTARVAPGTDFTDRDFFARHRDNADLALRLSGPYSRTTNGDELLVLSRRLADPDGRFTGVVAGALRLKYVEQLFQGIKVDDGAWITLLMTDGTIIARSPHRDGDIGRNISNAPLVQHFVHARAGQYEAVGGASRESRLFAYKQVGDLPLLISVSVPKASVLMDWWRKAVIIGALVACFILVVGAIGWMLYRELSRRALAEQRAHEHEERYRLLADNSRDLIVLTRDGQTVYVSPASRRLYGYDPDELLGTKIEDRVHPDDLPALAAAQAEVRAKGEALVLYRCRTKKGDLIWVEASWRESPAADGKSTELVVVARDITPRVRNEEALRAAKEHADAANRAKSSFLAHMSHEIRTPMNGILGMNHLLMATDLDARQRDYARTIGDSASSLLRIIDDILDESKLEAGKIEIEFADFDLSKTLDDVVSILQPRAAQKDVRLSMAVNPAACGWFRGDAVRLRQVLLNIAGNAVKFTDRGHVDLDVSVPRELGDHAVVRFEVADTGIGIDEAAQAKLFQKFTQADVSISRRFGGTGLGLAIAKQLVELMGGTIGFSSAPGAGSVFCFEIPLERVAAPAAKASAAVAVAPAAPKRALDVLIAEDNKINQKVAQLIISNGGHRVDLADDGRQAVDAARANHYDVILMDLQMPELDGIAAAKEIRQLAGRAGQVPIIALTSHAMAGMREEVIAAGMDDYVSKPFDASVLLAKLEHLAAFHRAGEQRKPQPAPERQDLRFDRDKLDQLRATTTTAAFVSLLSSLIQAIEQRVAATLGFIAGEELAKTAREAHDLVAIAGNVGGMRLSALSRQLQHACQAGDAAQSRAVAAELGAEAEALLPLMRDYYAAMAA